MNLVCNSNPVEATASKVYSFFNTKKNSKLNPVEANLKCSASTIQIFGFGTPHMENCSMYSDSTFHTCMILEPPIHRTASKVKYFSNLAKQPI